MSTQLTWFAKNMAKLTSSFKLPSINTNSVMKIGIEFAVFAIIASIWLVLGMLWYYISINAQVKLTRCAREKLQYNTNSERTVYAYDAATNNKLYSVTHNYTTNRSTASCDCSGGNFANNFSIPLVKKGLDGKTYISEATTKNCNCSSSYTDTNDKYYVGDDAMIRFYSTGDTTGFSA